MNVVRKLVSTLIETNDIHFFAMLREFLDPAMEKAENEVLAIDCLSNDENFHGMLRDFLSLIS